MPVTYGSVSEREVFEFNLASLRPTAGRSVVLVDRGCFLRQLLVLVEPFDRVQFGLRIHELLWHVWQRVGQARQWTQRESDECGGHESGQEISETNQYRQDDEHQRWAEQVQSNAEPTICQKRKG